MPETMPFKIKLNRRILALPFITVLCGAFALLFNAADLLGQEPEPLFVQVRATKLREQPLHWARPISEVQYGQKLRVVSQESAWYLVSTSAGSGQGYIHESAVSKKTIVMQSPTNNELIVPSDTDIVLAGKGFSKEIEDLYSSQNPELDLLAVNKLERLKVDPESLLRFLRQGGLNNEAQR